MGGLRLIRIGSCRIRRATAQTCLHSDGRGLLEPVACGRRAADRCARCWCSAAIATTGSGAGEWGIGRGRGGVVAKVGGTGRMESTDAAMARPRFRPRFVKRIEWRTGWTGRRGCVARKLVRCRGVWVCGRR